MCSFCGKRRLDDIRLVAGPGVWICEECGLCTEILNAESPHEKVAEVVPPPPVERSSLPQWWPLSPNVVPQHWALTVPKHPYNSGSTARIRAGILR